MKIIKILIVSVVIFCVLAVPCFAQVYESVVPSYLENSGGAWAEVNTGQGRAVFVVARNYIHDIFSFSSRSGYNVLNCSSNSITGMIYFKNNTNYYGNPDELQCRFSSFGTLEVYEPYYSVNRVQYRWTALNTTAVYNTNIDFADNISDRQNNQYIYTVSEKINIIILILVGAILLYFLLGRCWHA